MPNKKVKLSKEYTILSDKGKRVLEIGKEHDVDEATLAQIDKKDIVKDDDSGNPSPREKK